MEDAPDADYTGTKLNNRVKARGKEQHPWYTFVFTVRQRRVRSGTGACLPGYSR